LNDRAYGLIRHAHRLLGKEREEYAIPAADFAMMARAAGPEGDTNSGERDLSRVDWRALALRQGLTLLDVAVDLESRPPLAMA
jgi:acetolactate synthase-1/2/3 large subunit